MSCVFCLTSTPSQSYKFPLAAKGVQWVQSHCRNCRRANLSLMPVRQDQCILLGRCCYDTVDEAQSLIGQPSGSIWLQRDVLQYMYVYRVETVTLQPAKRAIADLRKARNAWTSTLPPARRCLTCCRRGFASKTSVTAGTFCQTSKPEANCCDKESNATTSNRWFIALQYNKSRRLHLSLTNPDSAHQLVATLNFQIE